MITAPLMLALVVGQFGSPVAGHSKSACDDIADAIRRQGWAWDLAEEHDATLGYPVIFDGQGLLFEVSIEVPGHALSELGGPEILSGSEVAFLNERREVVYSFPRADGVIVSRRKFDTLVFTARYKWVTKLPAEGKHYVGLRVPGCGWRTTSTQAFVLKKPKTAAEVGLVALHNAHFHMVENDVASARRELGEAIGSGLPDLLLLRTTKVLMQAVPTPMREGEPAPGYCGLVKRIAVQDKQNVRLKAPCDEFEASGRYPWPSNEPAPANAERRQSRSEGLMARALKAFEDNDLAGAEKLFRQVLVVEPDNVEANLWLGHTLAVHDPAGAVVFLRRGVERRPADVDGRFALACALRTIGKTEEARAEFRKVVELDPPRSSVNGPGAKAYQWLKKAEADRP